MYNNEVPLLIMTLNEEIYYLLVLMFICATKKTFIYVLIHSSLSFSKRWPKKELDM